MTKPIELSKDSQASRVAKVIAWPTVGVIAIVAFWSPLNRGVDNLASRLKDSEVITIGKLSIKISKRVTLPSPEVRGVLKDLSLDTTKMLLALEPNALYPYQPDATAKSLAEKLISLNLAKELSPDELVEATKRFPPGAKFVYGIGATPLGIETQSFLRNLTQSVVIDIINEINTGHETANK